MSKHKHFIKLIDLVNELKNKNWDYKYLSSNQNIYMQDIENNKIDDSLRPFFKTFISNNPNLTADFILKYPDNDEKNKSYNWDWPSITYKLGFSTVKKYPNLPWVYDCLTMIKIDDWDYVLIKKEFYQIKGLIIYVPLKYLDTYINNLQNMFPYTDISEHLSCNKYLTLDYIKKHPKLKWNFKDLSSHLPLSEIQKDLSLPWDYYELSRNNSLTSEFIIKHQNKGWSKNNITENMNINFSKLKEAGLEKLIDNESIKNFIVAYTKHILDNPEDFSDYFECHKNGIIKMKDILEHPELIRSYHELSYNPNLEFWYVLEHKDEKWDFNVLSKNHAFKIEDIIKGIEEKFNWDFDGLSKNPNITFDFVYQYKDENWNWKWLSSNKFIYEDKKLIISNKLKRKYKIRKNKKLTKLMKDFIIRDLINLFFKY